MMAAVMPRAASVRGGASSPFKNVKKISRPSIPINVTSLKNLKALAKRKSMAFLMGTEEEDQTLEDLEPGFVRYRPETLKELCRLTKFTKKEIQLMYRGFKQGCPSGLVTMEAFKDIYSQFFPQGESSKYAGFIFNTFDRDKNGTISFDMYPKINIRVLRQRYFTEKMTFFGIGPSSSPLYMSQVEFVVGLSVLSRGTEDEKLRWVFDLYDVDRDGLLTRPDIETVIISIYDMMGPNTEPPIDEHAIKEHVDIIFNKMDENGDGSITLDEFLDGCKGDQNIRQSLHLFDTIFSSVPITSSLAFS